MKIVPILMILYITLIGIIIFDSVALIGDGVDPYLTPGGTAGESSSIWNLFMKPNTWVDNAFIILITTSFLVAGAAIGAAILTKSDIALTTPLFVIILNSGLIPIFAIYRVAYREILSIMCTGSLNQVTVLTDCAQTNINGAILMSGIIVGPIAIAWILACIEWWTQRPTS